MRIAQVCGPFRPDRGGIARVVQSYREGLSKRGHEVHVISAVDEPQNTIQGAQVVLDRPRLRPMLLESVRLLEPDLVHVHGYASWLPANTVLLRTLGFPVVFTPHFHPFGTHPKWKRALFDLMIGNSVMRMANRVHALTEGEAETLVERFHVDRRRITVIPNPLPPFFADRQDPEASTAGAAGGGRKVVFVGRVDDQKGLECLLRAFKAVEDDPNLSEVTLEVIGDDSDPFRAQLAALSSELGLRRTTIVGPIPDAELVSKYRAATVLALPSSYEAFGMVLVEAMAFGCPVIATNAGGVPWIVHDGHNGLLVEYGDVPALSGALLQVLRDRGLRARLSSAARDSAAQYSLDRVALRLEGLYRRALGARASA